MKNAGKRKRKTPGQTRKPLPAVDTELAVCLWVLSEELTGVKVC